MPIYPIWPSYHPFFRVFFPYGSSTNNMFGKLLWLFSCIVRPVWGRIFLGPPPKKKATHWGCEKCPPGNSKNLLKKKDAEKKTDLTCIPCDKVVCMQPASYIFTACNLWCHNPVVSRWNSNAMCVHLYISYIKVQNGSRLCFPYIRTTVSWKVGKSQRWILFQQNLRHVKYSLWLDTPATNLSI